jgi:hypothetical protein
VVYRCPEGPGTCHAIWCEAAAVRCTVQPCSVQPCSRCALPLPAFLFLACCVHSMVARGCRVNVSCVPTAMHNGASAPAAMEHARRAHLPCTRNCPGDAVVIMFLPSWHRFRDFTRWAPSIKRRVTQVRHQARGRVHTGDA